MYECILIIAHYHVRDNRVPRGRSVPYTNTPFSMAGQNK